MDERIEVDGEVFEVVRRAGQRPVYDFTWVAGRHSGGYGFTSATYGGGALTRQQLEESIRDFLYQVNPETGFID